MKQCGLYVQRCMLTPTNDNIQPAYKRCLTNIGTLLLWIYLSATAQALTFEQPAGGDGTIAIEAENFSQVVASHDDALWEAIISSDAIAGSAVQAPLSAQSTSDFANNHARVDYDINFTQTGTYHLWMRGYAQGGTSDTLYVGLNGTPLSTAFFRFLPYKTWLWTDLKQGGSYFSIDISSPGVHTFNLWMRETGTIVDRIVLSKDSSFTPSGNGPDETPQSGGTGPDPEPETVATPVISPDGGSFQGSVDVSIESATAAAVIYYTLDGSQPDSSSIAYNAPFTLTDSTQVRAIAVSDNHPDSELVSAEFTANQPDTGTGGTEGLAFNESSGLVVMEGEHFTKLVASHDNVFWAAIDTSDAIADSAVQAPLSAQSSSDFANNHARVDYDINFTQTGTYHLWMRGYAEGGTSDTLYVGLNGTPLSTAFFRFLPYKTWIWTDLKQGGSYFSIDINSPGVHTLNLWMRETGTIVDRILLTKDSAITPSGNGPAESTQSGATDPDPEPTVATPVVSPDGGSFEGSVNVSIESTTPGAVIYYTLDGSQPGTGAIAYDAPFTLTASAQVRAIAVSENHLDSELISAQFSIEETNPGPGGTEGTVFNESGGLVAMEGEHFTNLVASHDDVSWGAINTPEAIASSAVQAPLSAQSNPDFANNHARADYSINFTQTGTYHLWMRGYAPDGASDTLYVGLNGTPLSTAFFRFLPYKTWIWTDLKQGGSHFSIEINSPGVHTLNLWMRETGTLVDRIVLSKNSALTPSGNGPAESTQSGGTDPDPDPQPEAIPGVTHYWQFNEAGGTEFSDRTGGSAQCSDCPVSESGPFGNALSFDGSGDILTAGYDSRLAWQANTSVTVEAWIKHSSSCLTSEAVVGRNDNVSGMNWWLGCDDGKAAFFMSDSSGNNSGLLQGTSTIDDNQWHHIAIVKDGFDHENRLYVDGQLEASQSTSYATSFSGNNTPLSIGGLLNAPANAYFSGQIDEVAIHNRALPLKSLSQHHADGDIGLHRGLIGCDAGIDVMPLGDSNTRGNGSIPRYSYRPYLYNSLDVAGYGVDFVGSLSETYPLPFQYDHDHQGHSGFTPAQIANNVINWLSLATPDVVLLHIGTNEHNVPDVETILDYIDLVDEDIIVILAKIINESVYNPATSEFNSQLEAMALARSNDKILLVDQESALNYIDDMDDNLHANNSGYAKMADVWYHRLSEFLPVCKPVTPQISSASNHTVEAGETLILAMDHVGYPQPTFSLQTSPPGMKINPDTGIISWTPATTGSYSVSVTANNSEGQGSIGFTVIVE